jgi:hypothetical protein
VDEEWFAFEDRQAPAERRWTNKGVNLLLIVGALILAGALLWMVIGPGTDPCKGAPAGAVIEDSDNPGSYELCKG